MNKPRKHIKYACFFFISLFLFGGCGEVETPVLNPSVKGGIDTEPATVMDITEVVCGTYTAVQTTEELVPGTAAYFGEFLHTRGESVKKGDLLATLSYVPVTEEKKEETKEEPDYELLLKQTDYEIACEVYDILLKRGGSGEEYERKLEIARIDKELALIALKEAGAYGPGLQEETGDKTDPVEAELPGPGEEDQKNDITETLIEIRAPFDGTIVYRAPFVSGDKVDADSPVMVVAGGETYLSGDYIYEANLKGNVQFFAYIDGKRTELEKYPYTALDYSMRRARFGLNGTHVETGSCIGVFVESVLKEKALCIPVDALKADKEGFYCFVLEDGRQVKKRVRTGIVTALVAEITEGLRENETVIVSTVSRDSAGTKTSTATYETFSNDNNYTGTTEYNNTTLYFENEGIMFSKFLVNEGQQVKKGDPVAECETIVSGKAIEDIEKEIERLTEKIDSFTASAEASKALILKNSESLPESEMRLAELKLIRTETELKRDTGSLLKEKDKLEKELKSLMGQKMTEVLYAPMDGVIDKLAYISEGTEITGSRWIAMMHSEEEEYIAITDTDMTVNAGVRVTVRANGNEYYDGTVVQSDSVLSGKGRTGKAYVLLDDKNVVLSRLQNVSVVVRKPVIEHVLTVPRSALMTSGDREYVLVARDGVCKKRYVTTGPSNGEFYCILNGISEGDTVVTQ